MGPPVCKTTNSLCNSIDNTVRHRFWITSGCGTELRNSSSLMWACGAVPFSIKQPMHLGDISDLLIWKMHIYSVHKVTVPTDLTFQHLHKNFRITCCYSGSKCAILRSGKLMICDGLFAYVLAKYQLLFYLILKVLTYWSSPPSSDKNAGSNRHCRGL